MNNYVAYKTIGLMVKTLTPQHILKYLAEGWVDEELGVDPPPFQQL